jgi:predicted nucleic acid-binding protein
MYLLDSNILIYWLKGQGNVAQHLQAKSPLQIKVPAPALFELEYGTAKSHRPQLQRNFIDTVVLKLDILPLDYPSAKAAGLLRTRRQGQLDRPLRFIDRRHRHSPQPDRYNPQHQRICMCARLAGRKLVRLTYY